MKGGQIPVDVSDGCPACGSPNVDVPDTYQPDTIVRCRECGHSAPWQEFFSDEGPKPDPSVGAWSKRHRHVWTPLADQGLFLALRGSWVRSCLRPFARAI